MRAGSTRAAIAWCDSTGAAHSAGRTLAVLSQFLIPGAPVPSLTFETLPDAGAAFSWINGRPVVLMDPRTVAGIDTWPGPDVTDHDRGEALTLLAIHELAHYAQAPESVHDHGAGYVSICQRFARKLNIRPPEDGQAGQWPMNLYSWDDGSALRALRRAREARHNATQTSR